jgi:phenylalanyl-tRNA synthetase beta chain
MLVSMLESLRNNARRGLEDVQVFELGRIFRNTGGSLRFDYHPHDRIDHDVRVQGAELLPLEQRSAGLALMGRPWTSRWGGGDAEVDFFWLKGVVAQVLADLGVPDVTYRPAGHPTFHPGRCAEVLSGDKPIGLLGEAHPRVSAAFDLPRRAYLAELNVDALMMLADAERERPSLSRFPAVDRDVACLVPVAVQAERVQEEIGAAAGTYKESVALFDVYQGANIPQGWRSLAYRITFRAADRTLEDAEVDDAMTRVRRALVDQVGATLR